MYNYTCTVYVHVHVQCKYVSSSIRKAFIISKHVLKCSESYIFRHKLHGSVVKQTGCTLGDLWLFILLMTWFCLVVSFVSTHKGVCVHTCGCIYICPNVNVYMQSMISL